MSAGALAIIGTSTSMARVTAEPMAPDELSIFGRAGDAFCRNNTAPSAARSTSFLLMALISTIASLMRAMAGSDRQPKAPRRKRGANAQACLPAVLLVALGRLGFAARVKQIQFQRFAAEDAQIDHAMQQAVPDAPLLLTSKTHTYRRGVSMPASNWLEPAVGRCLRN